MLLPLLELVYSQALKLDSNCNCNWMARKSQDCSLKT